MLRGLAVEGDGPCEVGAEVAHAARAKAGIVTSAAVSPDFGSIALAYLHRTVWEPGGEVTVSGRPARVVELPFGA
jgi:glycine cleavage system aminomethyltransferase T